MKKALEIVHKLAAPHAHSDEEIAALDEVQFSYEILWDKIKTAIEVD